MRRSRRRCRACSPLEQPLFQNVMAVALRIIWDVSDKVVAELFVEWPCLKAERRQEDSVAALRPGFVFGSPEEFRSVPLPAKRLRYPQGVKVEPPSPDVTK